jgi:hypothetical protein
MGMRPKKIVLATGTLTAEAGGFGLIFAMRTHSNSADNALFCKERRASVVSYGPVSFGKQGRFGVSAAVRLSILNDKISR